MRKIQVWFRPDQIECATRSLEYLRQHCMDRVTHGSSPASALDKFSHCRACERLAELIDLLDAAVSRAKEAA